MISPAAHMSPSWRMARPALLTATSGGAKGLASPRGTGAAAGSGVASTPTVQTVLFRAKSDADIAGRAGAIKGRAPSAARSAHLKASSNPWTLTVLNKRHTQGAKEKNAF
eukprot:GHVT01103282.1.p3 GENE.GHVT01103282.1~~GHVT01103282.1.p3  ORF type:complete len:110 (+),score=13.22 GHVT01103282.1:1226-1555(+)